MSANGTGNNSSIVDSNTQVSAKTFTIVGSPIQGSYSPYRHGGYSQQFDGNDFLEAPISSDFAFGTGDFTIECWVWRSATRYGTYWHLLFDQDEGAKKMF